MPGSWFRAIWHRQTGAGEVRALGFLLQGGSELVPKVPWSMHPHQLGCRFWGFPHPCCPLPWAELATGAVWAMGSQSPVWVILHRHIEISFNMCKNSLTEPLAVKSPEHEFWQGKSPLLSVMFQPLFYEYIQWQELACFQDNKIQTPSMIALKEASCHFVPLKKLTIWWAKCQK